MAGAVAAGAVVGTLGVGVLQGPSAGAATTYSASITAGATSVQTGQSVTLTVTANQNMWPTPYGLSIVDKTTGTLVAHTGGSPSDTGDTVLTTSVSQSSAGSHNYVAEIDNSGMTNVQYVSPPVTVTWTGGTDPPPSTGYSATISASASAAGTGQAVTLTATANQNLWPTPYGMSIVDTTLGTQVAHTGGSASATGDTVLTTSVSQSSAGSHNYVAEIDNSGMTNVQYVSPR